MSDADKKTGGDDGQKTSEKTFNQAEVDRMMQARLAREREGMPKKIEEASLEALNKWREENGISDEVLQKISGLDEKDQKIKSLEKELGEMTKQINGLDETKGRYLAELRETRLKNAVLQAASGKAKDPNDVWVHIRDELGFNEETLQPVILGDDGKPSDKITLQDKVEKLLSEKSYLAQPVGTPGSGSRPGRSRAVGGEVKTFAEMSRTERAARLAQRLGGG